MASPLPRTLLFGFVHFVLFKAFCTCPQQIPLPQDDMPVRLVEFVEDVVDDGQHLASIDVTKPFHPFLNATVDGSNVAYARLLELSYDLQPLLIAILNFWKWIVSWVEFVQDHPKLIISIIMAILFLSIVILYITVRIMRWYIRLKLQNLLLSFHEQMRKAIREEMTDQTREILRQEVQAYMIRQSDTTLEQAAPIQAHEIQAADGPLVEDATDAPPVVDASLIIDARPVELPPATTPDNEAISITESTKKSPIATVAGPSSSSNMTTELELRPEPMRSISPVRPEPQEIADVQAEASGTSAASDAKASGAPAAAEDFFLRGDQIDAALERSLEASDPTWQEVHAPSYKGKGKARAIPPPLDLVGGTGSRFTPLESLATSSSTFPLPTSSAALEEEATSSENVTGSEFSAATPTRQTAAGESVNNDSDGSDTSTVTVLQNITRSDEQSQREYDERAEGQEDPSAEDYELPEDDAPARNEILDSPWAHQGTESPTYGQAQLSAASSGPQSATSTGVPWKKTKRGKRGGRKHKSKKGSEATSEQGPAAGDDFKPGESSAQGGMEQSRWAH